MDSVAYFIAYSIAITVCILLFFKKGGPCQKFVFLLNVQKICTGNAMLVTISVCLKNSFI